MFAKSTCRDLVSCMSCLKVAGKVFDAEGALVGCDDV